MTTRLIASVAVGALAFTAIAFAQAPRGAPIPGGRAAAAGYGDIRQAVLIGKTERYKHFVLGSNHEAAGLHVTTDSGKTLEYMLPDDSVFEDREPRIADLDGDGRNEIVTIRSRQTTGSALAVLGIRDGALTILAESTPNGAPNRWLNPSSIGGFLGNGRLQVALVRMPHAVGRLEFWEFDGRALALRGTLGDTSNHRAGTDSLHLSAVIPRDQHKAGQRGDLLVIPSFDRRRLRVIAAVPSPHEVAGNALVGTLDGNISLRITEQGSVADIRLSGNRRQSVPFARDLTK